MDRFDRHQRLNLDDKTNAKLVENASLSGTPGFVRDVCSFFSDRIEDPAPRLQYLYNTGLELANRKHIGKAVKGQKTLIQIVTVKKS